MQKKIKNTFTKKDGGFTLIELLVVIAIIAILAALVLAALSSAQKGARDSKRRSDTNQYKTALVQYNADGNSYPAGAGVNAATDAGLAVLVPNYMNPRPTAPTQGTAAAQTYSYFQGTTGFCISVQLERNSNFIRTTSTRQYEDAAACSAAAGE